MITKFNQYQPYNEGLKKSLLYPAMLGSLLMTKTLNANTVEKTIDKIETISPTIKDQKLNAILDEIKDNLQSQDSAKYQELFDKLSSHIGKEYGYKIKPKNLDELKSAEIDKTDPNVIYEIIGWLASICLAICGLPQAWLSFKSKTSDGVSMNFLLLWFFGEIFGVAYAAFSLGSPAPLLTNYFFNIFLVGVMLYYKIMDLGYIKKEEPIDIDLTKKVKDIIKKIRR